MQRCVLHGIAVAGLVVVCWMGGAGVVVAQSDDAARSREAMREREAQGVALRRQGRLAQAAQAFAEAQRIAAGLNDAASQARLLNEQGQLLSRQRNFAAALDAHQRAQEFYRQLNDEAGAARSLILTGLLYRTRGGDGDAARSLEALEAGLSIAERLDDKTEIARALVFRGSVYYDQGRYDAAWADQERAVAAARLGREPETLANALVLSGVVSVRRGQYDNAVLLYREAIALFDQLNDKSNQRLARNNLGNIYSNQGNYRPALQLYEECLRLSEELNPNDDGAARAYGSVGLVHLSQGNYRLAVEHFEQTLRIFRELGSKREVSVTLSNIGMALIGAGDYDAALKNFQDCLAIRREIGHEPLIAGALNNIGLVHEQQGKYDEALDFLRQGLKQRETQRAGNAAEIVRSLTNISRVLLKQGKYDEALRTATEAAEKARLIDNPALLWPIQFVIGSAHLERREPELARGAFEDSIKTVESLRLLVAGGEQEQQRFFEGKVSPYHAMARLLAAQGRHAEALAYAERAKARVLLDTLQSGRVRVEKAVSQPDRERERLLGEKIIEANTALARERQRPAPDRARLPELEAQLQKARLDYEDFQARLYASYPALQAQRGEARVITPPEAAALLPDARTAFLEFVAAENQTLLLVITRGAGGQAEVASFPIAVKQQALRERVAGLRAMLAGRDNRYSRPARELYDLLLAPAAALLAGKTSLVIVPDGPLWEMPFQALITPQNRFLLEDCTLAYAPSLTVLRETVRLRRRGAEPVRAAEPPTLLALGNPTFDQPTGQAGRAARPALMDEKLEPLPDAEKQVTSLRALYGAGRSSVFIGPAATEERFKAEAPGSGVLHLATHGVLNDRSPMYSHLVLAQDAKGKGQEDGLLEAWELMKLDLKADLAVLSACETARGRVGAGEGMIGLTWALFVAGVPTTVVSQWKVRSDSTAELMVEFHRRLNAPGGARASKAESLRQAALKLLGDKNAQFRHPFYWAGFVVIGDAM
jgi:CHAT domain-containing protein/Tfp pilus assembly protein PilF